MFKKKISHPAVTMNVSSSDHCQKYNIMYLILSDLLEHFLTRTIFESPPLSLQAVCVATNVAGVDRKFFNIKLLRKATNYYMSFFSLLPQANIF